MFTSARSPRSTVTYIEQRASAATGFTVIPAQ